MPSSELKSPLVNRVEHRSEPPTICQVLHSLNVGGAEMLAYRLARRMRDRYRFVFACLDDIGTLGQELRQDGFHVELLSRQDGLDFGCARRLARFCVHHGVKLIHAHQYTPFAYSMLSGLAFRRPAILFTEHGRFFPDLPNRKRMVFNRLMLRRRDRVTGVGQSVRQALIENEGISPERIEVIYNGVNLSEFSFDAFEKSTARNQLKLSADAFVIAQVARLDHLKDHMTAVRVMERVVRQLPHAVLLVVGEGPERQRIEGEIERLKLEANVIMLGQRDDVSRILCAADVFLLTSISEGIPVTFIEAMGAQLPIVSTSVGGVPEVVQDQETGLLAPSGDASKLAEALVRLAGDPSLAAQMGRAGRERAMRQFTEEEMHAQYEATFDEMLGSRRPR